MKKILCSLLIFSFNLFCLDALHEAIQKVDLEVVEKILLTRSLQEEDRAVYLSVVDRKIEEINNQIFFDKFFPGSNPIWSLVGGGLLGLSLVGVYRASQRYSYRRDGIAPIAALVASFVASCFCIAKAKQDEAAYTLLLQQNSADAIRIRHRILKM